jgi:type II secretory pathway predicted ATPase ExeA
MSDDTRDIRAHFGLHTLPFTREIAVDKRWPSPIFDEALDALESTVAERMSAVLVAPSGAGKTSLLRALIKRLPEARYRVHYVKVTSLSKRDMCREIAVAVGASPAGSYPTLVRTLEERFTTTFDTDGLRPVLILDEAHDMRPDVLAILRILTNYQMDSRLVLSIILAGQPPLGRLLQRDELEAVSRRMAHCATLRLLSREEAREYMQHRAHIAGLKKLPFDAPALDAIYEMSRGNLRAIDTLCLKSLELATLRGIRTLDCALVAAARQLLP